MKYCIVEGCRALTTSGAACDEHTREKKKSKTTGDGVKRYKHKNKPFYNSRAWKDLSRFVYERDKGLCQRCSIFVHGREAHRHHIIPIQVAPELKLEASNIKLLCGDCHMIEEAELKRKKVPSYF